MLVGKAGSLPKSGVPEKCFTKVGLGLIGKQKRPARDKHPSLLLTFINYGCKKSYNVEPWVFINKTLYGQKRERLEIIGTV